jgi:hypothetical protein
VFGVPHTASLSTMSHGPPVSAPSIVSGDDRITGTEKAL